MLQQNAVYFSHQHSLVQWFPSNSDSPGGRGLAMSEDTFEGHQCGGRGGGRGRVRIAPAIQWAEARDAAKHLSVHEAPSTTQSEVPPGQQC